MAGIYIHVPFCKTRCIYCDFYSTTRSEWKGRYIEALCKELEMRYTYLKGKPIETLYFGGGTPSQLDEKDFRKVFDTVRRIYGMENCHEITLEANPDDLCPEYLQMLSELPFNRISMGIQTFDDTTLKLLKRRHNAAQAIRAVELCRAHGFRNISIDLIYGLPGETTERWEKDLQQAIALDVEHISAYHLRYEHYEISNFCKPGMYSRHNTSYWQGVSYLGCGPSAHSFDGQTREWNCSSIEKYMSGIESGQRDFEREERDLATRYNEFIITSVRTQWGISLERLSNDYGTQLEQYCLKMARPSLENGKLEIYEGALRLTREGIFISDSIMSDLLWVEN